MLFFSILKISFYKSSIQIIIKIKKKKGVNYMKILAIISSPRKQNKYNAIKNIESIHKEKYDE
jgi:hypothetical protein